MRIPRGLGRLAATLWKHEFLLGVRAWPEKAKPMPVTYNMATLINSCCALDLVNHIISVDMLIEEMHRLRSNMKVAFPKSCLGQNW